MCLIGTLMLIISKMMTNNLMFLCVFVSVCSSMRYPAEEGCQVTHCGGGHRIVRYLREETLKGSDDSDDGMYCFQS